MVYSKISPLVNRLSVFFLFRYFKIISSFRGCFFKLLEAPKELFQFHFLRLQPPKISRKLWLLRQGDQRWESGLRGGLPQAHPAHSDPHGPARVHTEPLRPAQTRTDPHRPTQTHSDPHRTAQNHSDLHRPAQNHSDPLRPSQNHSDPHRPAQARTDPAFCKAAAQLLTRNSNAQKMSPSLSWLKSRT